MTISRNPTFFSIVFLFVFPTTWGSSSSDLTGTNSIAVYAGTTAAPYYCIASAAITGTAAHTGTVVSVWDGNSSISFGTDTNSTGDVQNPFASASVLNPLVQIPAVTVTFNGSITAITPEYYGNYKSSGTGFSGGAPDISIADPDDGSDGATATATVSSGEITAISMDSTGSGYGSTAAGDSEPEVSFVAGPHFLRITDTESTYFGRVFLITDNTTQCVTISTSRLANGESTNISTYLPVGTSCEVVPAPTLGSTFGTDTTDLPTNWNAGLPDAVDWVYLWNVDAGGYRPYFFMNNSYEGSGWGRGWYNKTNPGLGLQNHTVLYPDEAFILAKRTTGTATFELDGIVESSTQKMYLPESGNQVLLKNPYGTDLLLGELIPSTAIGTGTGKFRPGTSSSDSNMDTVTFLAGGSTWQSFYYLTGTNSAVTSMRKLSARYTSATMGATDFYLGSGGVTNLESCDSSGSTVGITGNESNYTKVTLSTTLSPSGRSIPEAGFSVTFADLQGYLLYDGGTSEANASTGEEITDGSRGSIVYSDLIGTHDVVVSSGSYIVVEKQLDVTFKSDEGTPVWNVGDEGAGYSSAASFYTVGGNNGTSDANATGTVNISGSTVSISVSSAGAGYTSAPSVITTGGGWRFGTDTSAMGSEVLGASEGILLQRNSSGGVKAYFESANPFE